MAGLTEAQRNALRALEERNGSGVIDRHGRVVAAGEIVGGPMGPVSSATWARLMTFGLVEPDGPGRLRVTELGRATLAVKRKETTR